MPIIPGNFDLLDAELHGVNVKHLYTLFIILSCNTLFSHYVYDSNHVRYELVRADDREPYNWIFLPGGPGGDSSYLLGLIENVDLPGNVWLLDLPGNGSNRESVPENYDYNKWFDLFVPAIKRFENPILVGHSFGGNFPLFFPELETVLKGLISICSTPCLWLEEAPAYAKQFHLPDYNNELHAFVEQPNEQTYKDLLFACMPYYCPPASIEAGKALMGKTVCNLLPALWWLKRVTEPDFWSNVWVPQTVPMTVIGATYDCMCPYYLFQNDTRYQRPNITMIHLEEAGHIPWLDSPQALQEVFADFIRRL